jgi:hypothetical protein
MAGPQTQVSRGDCSFVLDRLRLGDYLRCGTEVDGNGIRHARWINASFAGNWGWITEISPNDLRVVRGTAAWHLLLQPYTRVEYADGDYEIGAWGNLRKDDLVFFTATANDPKGSEGWWSYLILQPHPLQPPPLSYT